jgi:hypothetical protein
LQQGWRRCTSTGVTMNSQAKKCSELGAVPNAARVCNECTTTPPLRHCECSHPTAVRPHAGANDRRQTLRTLSGAKPAPMAKPALCASFDHVVGAPLRNAKTVTTPRASLVLACQIDLGQHSFADLERTGHFRGAVRVTPAAPAAFPNLALVRKAVGAFSMPSRWLPSF